MLHVVRIHTAPWSRKSGRRPPCGIILTITALDIYLTICRQGTCLPHMKLDCMYRKGAHLVNTGAMTRCSKDLQQDRQQLSSSSPCSSILSTSTWWSFWGFEGAPTRWGWERDSGSCWKSTLPKIVYPKMCHKLLDFHLDGVLELLEQLGLPDLRVPLPVLLQTQGLHQRLGHDPLQVQRCERWYRVGPLPTWTKVVKRTTTMTQS